MKARRRAGIAVKTGWRSDPVPVSPAPDSASKRAIISSSSAPVRLESTWITLPA
jgi:hypothetical protein